MLSSVLGYLRCPRCEATRLSSSPVALECRECGRSYPIREGILDLLDDPSAEVITPFQRVMQSPWVASIYERFWRPTGYFLASSRPFSKEVRTVLDMLEPASAGRVLDLACGPGVFTLPLARLTPGWVVALDLSWPMLQHARRRLEQEGAVNALLIRATVFRLPFVSGVFDAVNCCGALHLFDRPEAAIEEIRRVMSPDGRLAVQTTIRPERSGGFAAFLEKFVRFGFFEEDELLEKLRLRGLKVLAKERHRISCTLLARQI